MSRDARRALAGCFLVVALAGCAAQPATRGHTITYYIAAEEVDWDYAPAGMNQITGKSFESIFENLMMTRGPTQIGRVYRKAIYREYTDSTFSTPKPRPPEWEHLGILGPLLRASVGDTIRVVFRNNATLPYSMHPHGVIYNKDSEGAPYQDGTSGADKADDAVPPGGSHVYLWPVPERAGPAPGEGTSVLWMYHSHRLEEGDLNAGLVGPMVVTARGRARPDGTPDDVDREVVVAFYEVDENLSPYYSRNVEAYADPAKVPKLPTFADFYYLSNLKETMNGFSYGNLPGLTMRMGERVRWYIFGTTNFEVHAPHWHGQTAVANHMRTDALSLTTMEMLVANMVPDNPGTWLFHCHVTGHMLAGMQSMFTVEEEK